jgi:hypothetical protein
MDLRSRLNVLISSLNFTDISAEAQDFRRDPIELNLGVLDYIYVGYNKTINSLYAAFSEAPTGNFALTVQYFNTEGQWQTLQVSDETKGFTRNGFITWARLLDHDKSAINDISAYWLRLRLEDLGAEPANYEGTLLGLNLVFSDDNDIASETPALVDPAFYPAGQNSHILQHVATKNYIMGRLRNLGYIKVTGTGEENINQWDVLDVFELRQAALYYTVAQIYFNLSDNTEDQYWAKYKQYESRFSEAFALGQLRIDLNDNGKVDPDEKRPVKSARWFR